MIFLYAIILEIHGQQNIKNLSSSLLSKNIKIEIYTVIIVPVFCKGMKLGRSR